jgi:hypothetical protein
MDMSILSGVTSILTPLAGFVAGVVNRKLDMQEAQLKRSHDIVMLEKTGQLQLASKDFDSLKAALEADASIESTSIWMADLRASVRPLITYFFGLSAVSFALVGIDNDAVTGLALLSVSYYFGARPAGLARKYSLAT